MRNPKLQQNRDNKMLAYFDKLSNETTGKGKRKYTFAYIYEAVAKKFDVQPSTAERRIKKILSEQ